MLAGGNHIQSNPLNGLPDDGSIRVTDQVLAVPVHLRGFDCTSNIAIPEINLTSNRLIDVCFSILMVVGGGFYY